MFLASFLSKVPRSRPTGHPLHLPLSCSTCVSLLLGLSRSPQGFSCFPLHKVCVPHLTCLPCALHPWTCRPEDNLGCSSWSCSQDLWLVFHLLGLHGVPARICTESSYVLLVVLPVPSLRCAPSLMLLGRISELMVVERGPRWRFG